ncbi:MAG: OsmC family protein [Bacteroidetes bacterium]|nr:OsmC family protein [Fibrella sp.]
MPANTVIAHIERTPYETHIWTDTNVLVADEPPDVGGQGRGMNPFDLLQSALASCTVMTLRMYADRKGWPRESVAAHVRWVDDENDGMGMMPTSRSQFTISLNLNGPLSDEQRRRLLEIARRCPIHRLLTNPIAIATSLIEP